MKRVILAILSIAILAMATAAKAVEIKTDDGEGQLLLLTEAEYQNLNDDPYKLFSGVWMFEIGKKIPFDNLKFDHDSIYLGEDLVKKFSEMKHKLSMYDIKSDGVYVDVKKYHLNIIVDGKYDAQLDIFSIGKDNICFGYRLNIHRGGELQFYRKNPILELTGGNPHVKDIELPSGEILKSVKVENYVQGLYISRFDEIFRNIYNQISANYDSAMASKPTIIEKYKNGTGLGIYKFGMTLEEVRIIDEQAKEAPNDVEKFKVYTEYGDIIFSTKVLSSGKFRMYFSDSDNVLIAVRKYLENPEIKPTAEHIMKNYQGEIFKYNKRNEQHLPAINIIIGRNGDKARYMMDVSGLSATSVVIYQPWLYDRAVEILKERQQKAAESSKSAIE